MSRKKVVSLIGSDTILGGSLLKLNSEFSLIEHLSCSLIWKKPFQVERELKKGFPDVHIICYSVLDDAEAQLLNYLKIVTKVAKKTKAKIIGFVDYRVFDGNSYRETFDESVQPHPQSDKGKTQYVFEERLLRYPNSLIFRLGQFWSEEKGAIHRFLKQLYYGEKTRLTDWSFSLTSEDCLLRAICKGIENDMVFVHNLVDRGVVTEVKLFEQFCEFLETPSVDMRGEEGIVLDGRKWETLSMTDGSEWSSLVKQKVSSILKSLHGT